MHLCPFMGAGTGSSSNMHHQIRLRDPQQGYKVVHVVFTDGWPVSSTPFFYYSPAGGGEVYIENESCSPFVKGAKWQHKLGRLGSSTCGTHDHSMQCRRWKVFVCELGRSERNCCCGIRGNCICGIMVVYLQSLAVLYNTFQLGQVTWRSAVSKEVRCC
jgi:hypothetical protein